MIITKGFYDEIKGVVEVITTNLSNNKAYQYAVDCIREDNKNVNKYVKKQCQEFLNCVDSEHYYIDEKALNMSIFNTVLR